MYTGILDVSHWEYDRLGARGIVTALASAKAAGIGVVIAKATQGKDYVDPSWKKWARAVRDAGLLLGAYHFNSNTSPGDDQAEWFLKALDDTPETYGRDDMLLCLDYERNPNPAHTMTQSDARAFVHRIHARTGQRPTVYGDSSFLGQFNRERDVLAEFPLWVAAYGPSNPKLPKAWSTAGWTLFQYTNGTSGPGNQTTYPRLTPGFGKCDRSAFDGTFEELRAAWPFGRE